MEKGDIKLLKVVKITDNGAFLKWDNNKDIFIPKSEQLDYMQLGEEYLVIICVNEKTNQYYASERIDHYLKETVTEGHFHKGQEIEIVVYDFTKKGVKAAIEKQYRGLLFNEEIFQELELGQKLTAYIKQIREDSKIDITLAKQGYKNVIKSTVDVVIDEIKKSGGFIPFNDKSDAQEIYKRFNISKNAFKQALGLLYK